MSFSTLPEAVQVAALGLPPLADDDSIPALLCKRKLCGKPVLYENLMYLRGGRAVHIRCP